MGFFAEKMLHAAGVVAGGGGGDVLDVGEKIDGGLVAVIDILGLQGALGCQKKGVVLVKGD